MSYKIDGMFRALATLRFAVIALAAVLPTAPSFAQEAIAYVSANGGGIVCTAAARRRAHAAVRVSTGLIDPLSQSVRPRNNLRHCDQEAYLSHTASKASLDALGAGMNHANRS